MIDAPDIYDKALGIVHDALDGKVVDYRILNAAMEVVKPIMQSIYFERSRGEWADRLDDDKENKE